MHPHVLSRNRRRRPVERRFPYGLTWVVFLAALFVGGALVLSDDAGRRAWGLVLILAPVVVFGALMAVYYGLSRRAAR